MEIGGSFRLQVLEELFLLSHVGRLQAQRQAQHLTRVVVLNELGRAVHYRGRGVPRVWAAGDI